MTVRRGTALLAGAAVFSLSVACQDIPLLPHWNADWNVPLPSQNIALYGPFTGTVPAGASASVSFAPQRLALDGTIGSLLDQQLTNASLVLTISKNLPVSATDTVFVAPDSAGLTTASATRIVVPVNVAATDLVVTDTVPVTTEGVVMLQTLASARAAVWVQLRGRVLFAGPGTLTIAPGDSVHVRLSLLATIAVSR